MARTTRKYMTDSNYREARGGRNYVREGYSLVETRPAKTPWAPRYGGPSRSRGGMLMSPRSTGWWSDEYGPSNTAGAKRSKRAIKRVERSRALREVKEFLDNPADL